MQQLSSDLTVIYKRAIPIAFTTAIAFFIAAGIYGGRAKTLGFFITPAIIFVIGFAFWYFLISELADEVADHGAYLLVRVGALKDRVPLGNLKNVRNSWNANPPIMTLDFVAPCKHGLSISFMPRAGLPFSGISMEKLKESLLHRADIARRTETHGEKGPVGPAFKA